jgi:hypothetical protein
MPYLQAKTLYMYGLNTISISCLIVLILRIPFLEYYIFLGFILTKIFYIRTFIYFEILFYLLESISYPEFLSGFFIYRGNIYVRSRNYGTSRGIAVEDP